MRIVVIGGSAAGLMAALLLARGGHEVILLERDGLDAADDVEAAARAAFRATAPQIVQPHIIMPRCRELLMAYLPDVYDALLQAGVREAPLQHHMPPTLRDTTPMPGDERLVTLNTRRSTFDWVLRRIAQQEDGIGLRPGVRASGLLAHRGTPPRVTGVRTEMGDLPADLVVDATGRRSAVDDWLLGVGAGPGWGCWAECGVTYYSRHYRLRPRSTPPGRPTTRIVAGLAEFTAGIWGADNGVMQVAVAPLSTDRRFRTVKRPDVFEAVLRTVPLYAAWLDVLDPITEVFPMAGPHNTLRRLAVDGDPVVLGLVAVGDSVCTTNPTLGRGLTLALQGAVDLAGLVATEEEPVRLACRMDELVGCHVLPYYEDQAATDHGRLQALRHLINGAPAPPPAPLDDRRVTFTQLRVAAATDPVAFRGLWRIQGMLSLPGDVYTDPEVVASTHAALRRGDAPVMAQPTREQLLAALAA